MARVLLTGATGFVGGHLLVELAAAGHTVRALVRRPEATEALQAAGAELVNGALDDPGALAAAVDGCEAVFHAAADTSVWRGHASRQMATNVDGTVNLLRAAESAGVGAFVHTSSVSAYSHRVHGVLTEDVPQRGDESWIAYERSKHLAEQAVRLSGQHWIICQPSHVLGPGDRHNWSRLFRMVDQGTLPGVPPGAGAFADVRQVARAQRVAWERQRFRQAYLLGGEQTSFLDLLQRVARLLDRPVPARAMPGWVLRLYAQALDLASRLTQREPTVTPEGAAFTCHVLQVDSAKARRELDYVETPLDMLLADTLAWMRTEGMLRPD